MDAGETPLFGRLLRDYRLAAGLSQERLAQRSGLSVRGISDLERGARTLPRLETVTRLADALGLDHDERASLLAAARRIPPADDGADVGPVPVVPRPVTPLIGREAALLDVRQLVLREDVSLVTLTGPGGVGKTSLVLSVANDLDSHFPDGVTFVSLAPVVDSRRVAPAIGSALGLRDGSQQHITVAILSHLRARKHLLILDNFEHLVDAAPFVADLMTACPGVTVVVTSRERLRLRGERIWEVPPLGLTVTGDCLSLEDVRDVPAVRLFVERAGDANPGFMLTEFNAPAILDICRRLDGLPLALELAAAWVTVLPPADLLTRLERRLPLLTYGPRDAPMRQQTLRNTIDWSFGLLSESERRIFWRLSVFVGGFDLAAAEHVARPTPDDALGVVGLVAALADKSLLQRTGECNPQRFTMLDTIREFALEKLASSGEEDAIRASHAAYFVEMGERTETHLLREVHSTWLDRLELDHDNIRGALRWTLARDANADAKGLGLRLAGALWLFWYYHGHLTEGRWWLERGLVAGDAVDDAVRAKALVGLGTLAHTLGDKVTSMAWLSEGLSLFRKIGDTWGTAFALSVRGNLAEDTGKYDEAERFFSEANTLFADVDDGVNVAVTLYHLGVVAFGQGDMAEAENRCSRALHLSRQMQDQWGTANSLACLGLVHCERGDVRQAAAALDEALSLFAGIGSPDRIADMLCRIAVLEEAYGDHGEAIRLFSAAGAMKEGIGVVPSLPESAVYDRAEADAATTLSRESCRAWWDSGRNLDSATIVNMARDAVRGAMTANGSIESTVAGLSTRELDVLRLMARGKTDREIGEALFISHRTVNGHIARIFDRLGVHSRAEAAVEAVRLGLLHTGPGT